MDKTTDTQVSAKKQTATTNTKSQETKQNNSNIIEIMQSMSDQTKDKKSDCCSELPDFFKKDKTNTKVLQIKKAKICEMIADNNANIVLDDNTKQCLIKELNTNMVDTFLEIDNDRIKIIDEAIKKHEEENKPDDVKILSDTKKLLEEFWSLDKFAEFCLTCKIKKSDLDKPKSIMSPFHHIYSKFSNKKDIPSIEDCLTELKCHLKEFTDTHKLMLCLACCKYWKNTDLRDNDKYLFTYYFIRNIHLLNRIYPNGECKNEIKQNQKEFYERHTKNLSRCMTNLITRNPNLKDYTLK